jgi:hypothetical protein
MSTARHLKLFLDKVMVMTGYSTSLARLDSGELKRQKVTLGGPRTVS